MGENGRDRGGVTFWIHSVVSGLQKPAVSLQSATNPQQTTSAFISETLLGSFTSHLFATGVNCGVSKENEFSPCKTSVFIFGEGLFCLFLGTSTNLSVFVFLNYF